MTKFLIPFSLLTAASVAMIFPGLFGRFKDRGLACLSRLPAWIRRMGFEGVIGRLRSSGWAGLAKARMWPDAPCSEDSHSSTPDDMSLLHCRVRQSEIEEGGHFRDAFSVEICGSIQAPSAARQATLMISILDVTDGSPTPVQAWADPGASPGGPNMSAFCHRATLGRLPQKVTTLPEWTAATQMRVEDLVFARRGRRNLQLEALVSSADSGEALSKARCTFAYDNPALGYLDLQENAERTKVLAVALAFAVSAADDELRDCEIELIENWAKDNILASSDHASENDARQLEQVLSRTVAFFREGNKLDTHKICEEIGELAPIAQRYDILDLCLYVARADGFVAAEELTLLKDLARWLEVDAEKFRLMMEKVLPIDMHEVTDVEAVLGLTSDMSKDKARQHLNKEYSKWNARVTHADPGIQSQADQMLKLIAEARSQYTAEPHMMRKSQLDIGVESR